MFTAYISPVTRRAELNSQRPLKFPRPFDSYTTRPSMNSYSAPLLQRSNKSDNVSRRVLSAKDHRMKQIQNQLTDAHMHISALTNENRILRSIQKRMEFALQRYEGSNAEIPKLLDGHGEEIRSWQIRHRRLKSSYKEVSDKLKSKEVELLKLNDEHKQLLSLSKNMKLGEREELQAEVSRLKDRIEKQNETIGILQRKSILDNKSYKFKLHTEVMKHKQTQLKLNEALSNCDRLTAIIEKKDKVIAASIIRRNIKGINTKQNDRVTNIRNGTDISTLDIPNNEISSFDSQNSFESYMKAEETTDSTYTLSKDIKSLKDVQESFTYNVESGDIKQGDPDEEDNSEKLSSKHEKSMKLITEESQSTSSKDVTKKRHFSTSQDGVFKHFDHTSQMFRGNETKSLLELEKKLALERNLMEEVIDNYCDSVIEDIDSATRVHKKIDRDTSVSKDNAVEANVSTKTAEVNNNSALRKRNQLDEEKKQKLLAALKAIDLGEDDGLAISNLKKDNATKQTIDSDDHRKKSESFE